MLFTDRLEIAPLTLADVADFVAYRTQPHTARFQSWDIDYSDADAEELVAAQPASGIPTAGQWVQLGLHLRATSPEASTLVGDVAIGADENHPDTYELGVTLREESRGCGYAYEALTAVTAWLMGERNAHRIVMQCDARNEAVLALVNRLGFRHEGSVVEGDWFKGEWSTLDRYALLEREWAARP